MIICSGLIHTQNNLHLQYESSFMDGLRILHLSKSIYRVMTMHQLPSYRQWSGLENVTVS